MSPEHAPSAPPASRVIAGRFRIDRLIGQGGMGEVYAARNLTTGREVAIKMIGGAAVKSAEHTRRFLREAKAATAIRHPNVIEVLDAFEDDDGTPVMVMELLHGETLSGLRKRKGALRLHELAAVLAPVCRALAAAHTIGIVHRDLKPDNIFLAEDGARGVVPKVLDFGIAKLIDPTSIGGETQGDPTSTGAILGTPHYMSLEQAMSDKSIDQRTDVWSIGVIAFEGLTGRRPLEFENLGQMYKAFLQGSVVRLEDVLPELPREVAGLIDRCLAKEKDARLADLGELAQALERYTDPAVPGALAGGVVLPELATIAPPQRSGETIAAVAAAAPPPGRARMGVALLALVAIGGAAGFWGVRAGRAPATPAAAPPPPTTATAAPELTAPSPPPTATESAATPPLVVAPVASSVAAAPQKRPPRAPASASAAPAPPPTTGPGGVIVKPPF